MIHGAYRSLPWVRSCERMGNGSEEAFGRVSRFDKGRKQKNRRGCRRG